MWDDSYRWCCSRAFPPAEPACCPWRLAAAAPGTGRHSLVTRSGWSCSVSRWASGRGWQWTWHAALPCCPEGCRYSGFSPPTTSKWRVKPRTGDTCPQCCRRGRVHRVQQVAQKTNSWKPKRKKITEAREVNQQATFYWRSVESTPVLWWYEHIVKSFYKKWKEKLVKELLDVLIFWFAPFYLMWANA